MLTASIAHEINQPLAAIITNGETSLRWLARDDPNIEKVRTFTERVVAEARRASEIIERIRGMASQRAPEHKLLSIDDVIDEWVSFLRHELLQKGIVMSLDLARSFPNCRGPHSAPAGHCQPDHERGPGDDAAYASEPQNFSQNCARGP